MACFHNILLIGNMRSCFDDNEDDVIALSKDESKINVATIVQQQPRGSAKCINDDRTDINFAAPGSIYEAERYGKMAQIIFEHFKEEVN